MDRIEIGMYALLALSGFAVVMFVIKAFQAKDGPSLGSLLGLALSFGMAGVSVFGPAFLTDYGDFVETLGLYMQTDDEAEQSELGEKMVTRYASGAWDDDTWPLIEAAMLTRPTPDVEEILDRGRTVASERPDRVASIDAMKTEVNRIKASEIALLEPIPGDATAPDRGVVMSRERIVRLPTRDLRWLMRAPNVSVEDRAVFREELLRRDP